MSGINWERDKAIRKGREGIPIEPSGMSLDVLYRPNLKQWQLTWLNVPYADKNEAKKLGARWNPNSKKWYCIKCDSVTFKKWL